MSLRKWVKSHGTTTYYVFEPSPEKPAEIFTVIDNKITMRVSSTAEFLVKFLKVLKALSFHEEISDISDLHLG